MKKLYPNCVPVVGSRTIAFYDLDQQRFTLFPKESLYKADSFSNDNFLLDQVSAAGLDLLTNKGLLISNSIISHNTEIQPIEEHEWNSPSIITNATIEMSEQNGLLNYTNSANLFDMLAKLICKHLFIKLVDFVPVSVIRRMLDKIQATNVYSLQLVLPFNEEYYSNEFGRIIISQQKVSYVIIENSPFDKNIEDKIFFSGRELVLGYDKREAQFHVNHSLFEESQLHHTYFNRKLHIGAAGEIKNALETDATFGYIQEILDVNQLKKIIGTPEFQYYWFAHKNICEVCKDCEYKHMCVDNRVPAYHDNGSWYHTRPCNYDPYTGQWN